MCHLWLTLKELSIPDGERGNDRADAGMCCESDHVGLVVGGGSPLKLSLCRVLSQVSCCSAPI